MRVIEHGNTFESYECKCPLCGCLWVIDEDEARWITTDSGYYGERPMPYSTCPECGCEEVEAKRRIKE